MNIKDYLCATCNAEIMEQTAEAIKEFGTAYGADLIILNKDHINALIKGKMVGFSDGEYVHFLVAE